MQSRVLIKLDDQQAELLRGARAAWHRYLAAEDARSEVNGAVAWKTVKGRQYLVRSWYDRHIGAKRSVSLGLRSPEIEATKASFEARRAAADKALEEATAPLDRLSRLGKALRLGRLNTTAAEVLRELRREQKLGAGLYVIGSAAVAGYEARAGVFLSNGLELAAGDLDLCTTLPDGEEAMEGMLPVLRRADGSFRLHERASAVNDRGFHVDLHLRRSLESWADNAQALEFSQRHLLLDAVRAAPIRTVAIAKNGMPVEMVCPDPRDFAAVRYAMFLTGLDRRPPGQAIAVGRLVQHCWPEKFSPSVLARFPDFAAKVAPVEPRSGDDGVLEDPDDRRLSGP